MDATEGAASVKVAIVEGAASVEEEIVEGDAMVGLTVSLATLPVDATKAAALEGATDEGSADD